MSEIETCPTCGRKKWDGSEAISITSCHRQRGESCLMVRDLNTLLTTAKRLVKMVVSAEKPDTAELRTVLAVIEEINPSRNCPLCGQTSVVRKTNVAVHFARASDLKPCEASFGSVIAGILVPK